MNQGWCLKDTCNLKILVWHDLYTGVQICGAFRVFFGVYYSNASTAEDAPTITILGPASGHTTVPTAATTAATAAAPTAVPTAVPIDMSDLHTIVAVDEEGNKTLKLEINKH